MNKKMEDALKKAIENLDKMTHDEFFLSVNGFTRVEEENYSESDFLKEISNIERLMENGVLNLEYQPNLSLTRLFWNKIKDLKTYTYEVRDRSFPVYIDEFESLGLIIETVYGQGSITIIRKYDFNTIEYAEIKSLRQIQDRFNKERKRKQNLIKKFPKPGKKVSFDYEINGDRQRLKGVILECKVLYPESDDIYCEIQSLQYGKMSFVCKKSDVKTLNFKYID